MKKLHERIKMGYWLSHEEAERITRQKISSRVFDWSLAGNRMHVVIDEVPDKIGSVVLAESTKQSEQQGAGWIIAAGHEAGMTKMQASGNLEVAEGGNPGDLLGLHVAFRYNIGVTVRSSPLDSDYKSQVVAMMPSDVISVDMNPDPFAAEEAAEEEYLQLIAGREDEVQAAEDEAAARIDSERRVIVTSKEDALRAREEG